jgi:ribosomal protein S18 acetylase RimI-like enzyme
MLTTRQIKNKLAEFLTIQRATTKDAFGIVEVRRNTWLETFPNKQIGITYDDIKNTLNLMSFTEEVISIAKKINNCQNIRVWVAKNNDTVIGYILAKKQVKVNRIEKIYVYNNYQKLGVGKKLLNEALDWLGTEKQITLETASYTTATISFYKSCGFVENGPHINEAAKLLDGKEIPVIRMIKYPTIKQKQPKVKLLKLSSLPRAAMQ